MNILIKETGELRSLSFIDWHDGQEYTEQLISASGEDPNFLFDQDGEVFMTDAPTFSKWNAFFRSHYDIESVCAALGLQPISKADRESFLTSAERKDRGREGKPMLGGVVVNTLSMSRVTCECFCYRCKAFLRALLFFLHVTFTKAFTRNFSL